MTVMLKKFPTSALIGGEWVTSAKTFPVLDPVMGRCIATVPDLSVEHAARAIDAAEVAFETWSRTTAKERAAILRRWFDLVTAETEALALLLTTEQGKPLSEARAEIAYGASYIEWFAEEAKRAYGRTIPASVSGKRYFTLKQPVGVVAAITPWNFPVAMITRKVAPALAAGCTIVVKPSEETPLSALALAKLAVDAGVPAGVLNVITTLDAQGAGGVLCSDARIRKLSFTGSTAVGATLYRQCARTVKKLTLELGGNAPLIVFDDADIDQAVAGTMASKFRNAGQTCVCANRILVQSGIFDRFTVALAEKARKLLVAPGTHPQADIGPLINDEAIARVERLVSDARTNGAEVVTGGAREATETRFYRPTVLTGITPEMEIAREEIFGPVAALTKFETEEDGIRLANATPFGLAAYVFTRDLSRALRVSERIETGMVGINEGIISSEVVPFGGIKQSGLGREGASEGLDEYLETKFVCVGGLDT